MIHSRQQKNKIKLAKDLAFKQSLLSQFPCITCGEIDSDLIDWHHVNPDEKVAAIATRQGHERWWTEVLKCVPLCALCHRKLHMDKLCLLPMNL